MDLDLFDPFVSTSAAPPSAGESSQSLSTFNPTSLAKRTAELDAKLSTHKRARDEEGVVNIHNNHVSNGAPKSERTSGSHGGPPSEPAKVYKFKLDSFQQEAVNYIEREESVLVAAHTSAGKTAVAEYAIAKSLKNKQRVIYTSPIKALSNQKYRDLQEEFGDVGLMTGDMTINPNATCLIMTTEILRSMLYRGSEVMREVAWVIYDEVHYMRDKERGVVWEESIILLPHKVRFVFLSATIPNAASFVDWVSQIHHQPCHVVYTDYRPVPLQHFVFPACAEGLFLVVDERGRFREDNFQRAMGLLQGPSAAAAEAVAAASAQLGSDAGQTSEGNSQGATGGAGRGRQSRKQSAKNMSSDLFKIVKLIMDRALDPCIVFSFSKKDCEAYALQMARLDFNTDDEKALVEQVFLNAMDALSEDDRQLPQVVTILPLLKRGVGIHHGGLLPILKEVIEILFQEGLIKCLFATETFSIGINMPAKTVVFTATRKYDGKDFRWITSGEYIQMSGRAGRRGKDDRGIVIQMLDEKMEPDVAKNMIYGASDPLFSSYRVSYNMVMNMLRVEDANPESLIRCSFHQFQQEQQAPALERQAEELRAEAGRLEVPEEACVEQFYVWSQLLCDVRRQLADVVMQPQYCLPFLQSGRLAYISCDGEDWGWGVVVNVRKADGGAARKASIVQDHYIKPAQVSAKAANARNVQDAEYVLDVLLHVVAATDSPADQTNQALSGKAEAGVIAFKPVPKGNPSKGESAAMVVLHVHLSCCYDLSAIRVNVPKDLTKTSAKNGVQKALAEIRRRFEAPGAEGLPLLHPTKDLAVPEAEVQELQQRRDDLLQRLSKSPLQQKSAGERDEMLAVYAAKKRLLEEAAECLRAARESQAVVMREELRKMRRVLRRLEFVTPEGVLALKGRFSCEVSTADELVVTNMVFDGIFSELSVDQVVGLLSCFVHKEGGGSDSGGGAPRIRADMQNPYRQLQAVARNVAKVCADMLLTIDEEEYVSSFNPDLVDVAYAWSAGAKFSEVCRLTDVFEGSIIRALRRLEELLRQLAAASQAIGNTELVDLFEEGARRIRRGVVFAASLYL